MFFRMLAYRRDARSNQPARKVRQTHEGIDMTIAIGNAPCSWGVEFPNDLRNPPWAQVLEDCREAGYRGIELGPIGYMPENPAILGRAFGARPEFSIRGVVFRPFHDGSKWDEVKDAGDGTCRSLTAHGANGFRSDRLDFAPPRPYGRTA